MKYLTEKDEKMLESICGKLNLSKEEEIFMSNYNPLTFYSRLMDLGLPKDLVNYIVKEKYEPIYDSVMKMYSGGRKN